VSLGNKLLPPCEESLLGAIEGACDPRGVGFVECVEAALRAGLALLAANPDLAHRLAVAPFAAEEDAVRHHQRRLERFGNLLRAAAEEADVPPRPDSVETTIVAGINWQISRQVLAGGAEDLEALLPSLLEFVLAFYLDPGEVGRVARAAAA
jgi:hypothetical protein